MAKNAAERVRGEFRERFGAQPAAVSSAPGRVNVIGEHTDYNGGFVLPMAVDRRICVAFRKRTDRVLQVYSGDFGESFDRDIDDGFLKSGNWSDYVSGSLEVVKERGVEVPGLDVAVAGDVPVGAGLSSSAAFEVACVNAFLHAAGADWEKLHVIKAAQRAENHYVGVMCGIMDQFTSVLAEERSMLFIDCMDLSYRNVPLGSGVSIVVLDTTVQHTLGTEYNERRSSCEEAARRLLDREAFLREVPPELLERNKNVLTDIQYRRARHVITEDQRVERFIRALEEDDLELAGGLMYASHNSLRDDFEVSCPELDLMVSSARGFFEVNPDSGFGARMTGGGFGGCTVNLVSEGWEQRFIDSVLEDYREKTGLDGRGWTFHPATGAAVSEARS